MSDEKYGVIRGLNGAYYPSAHYGPFDTYRKAMSVLEGLRERDIEDWHTWEEDDRPPKPEPIQEDEEGAYYIIPRGKTSIDMKVEVVTLDEDVSDDWGEV